MAKQTKIFVIIALMLGTSLASLDATIVSTVMPAIVGKLGGLPLYSWVFSVYLLTSTTTVPIYGKLADLYGRKPLFLFGSTLFLLGSVLAGLSQDMVQLIIFRAIQGLGAGAVLPLVMTMVGDLFSLSERAKVQGLFSGVWGVSSLLGPVVGGLIVDHADWRWVFYINAPFGLISIFLIIFFFKEQVEQKKRQIDYIGAATLSAAIVVLLFALLQGGTTWAWNSLESIGLFVIAAVLLVVFVIQELRFPEPVLPMTLFTDRMIVTANIGNAMLGVIMFSVTSYVTLFLQGARGETATNAGLALIPYLFSWSVSATFSAKVILRYGYRITALLGCILATIGVALTLTFQVGSNIYLILFSMLLIGAGFGFSSSTYTLSVQGHVPWNLRGVATASGQFFRTIGGTVGVAVMGTVLNAQMAQNFAPIFARFSDAVARLPKDIQPSNLLLKPEIRATLPAAFVTQLQTALASSLFWIYALMFFVAVIGLLAAIWLPAGKTEGKQAPQESEPVAIG